MKILNTKKVLLALAFLVAQHLPFDAFAQDKGDEDKEMFNRGKERDQQALDEALKTWYPQSMKNHDQRIAWWQQARFGMFIHWGVYSVAGGEWKGQKVSGYAEHLMRKEKISRADYLNLASQFNPVEFNAEQWILTAKNAGMKYFIITAKHHDGFALFDSKVSDFDVVDQTPFKRDPMKELADAARKYGMKFGFYYSHAFDWEHPDAPGNDWEYKNPGGDQNLYGGREWYDVHPELLEKAKHYVDQKAIPQIVELLQKYHPDILWFDTPQKLPLSENVRILKAIRQTDPNVVVNGRLVRGANSNFGDYKNTADRPAEFFPVTGDWEAIPTTNESYGYHKFDQSHKPVSHFIQLLASAASRGGNLLMNIGPMGNGAFDPKDLNILKGIGSWLAKNGASIYGTQAGPLPLQSWGVSTLKNNKLYLHIFQWPSNGKLVVGGLKSDVSRISLLTDPSKTFKAQRLNTNDLVISLPMQAPDSINTVLVLDLKGKLAFDSVRVVSDNVSLTRLLAFDAVQNGKGFSFGDGKTDRYYVEGWKSMDQSLSWKFRTNGTADYKVMVKYLAPAESSGGIFGFSLDDYFTQNTVTTIAKSGVVSREIGTVSLKPGTHTMIISPVKIAGAELMKFLEVQLMPVKQDLSVSELIKDAEAQTRVMLQSIPQAKKNGSASGATPGSAGTDLVSPRTLEAGELKLVTSRDWTSGFFPGVLWQLYALSNKPEWKAEAIKYTANIEKEKFNGGTHDMGFKIYCSFGKGYSITRNPQYREVIIQSARTLSTRFNEKAGVIKSWDNRTKWKYPVIIDNMMNLELLFEATKLSGDSSYYKIASQHALTTMRNHFRSDYSSFHVVDYDTVTGAVLQKTTHQGYSDASAWSRGQAWGLYGYTMCYRETGNKAFLAQAEKIAGYILNNKNLPSDKIPYWDFSAPGIPKEPRDVSAAAVIASALYELSTYSTQFKYKQTADLIMSALNSNHRAAAGEASGFLLLHSTGAKPSNSEVDVPLSYADYYYLEAMLRKRALDQGKKISF